MVWNMFTLILAEMMQFDAPICFKRVGEPTRFCIYFLPVGKESWTCFANLVECQWSGQGYVTVNDPGVLTATLALTRDKTYPSIQWSRLFSRQTDKMNPKMSIKFHQFPPFWAHNTTPATPTTTATCPRCSLDMDIQVRMDIQDLASFFMDKRVLKVMDPRISNTKNTGFCGSVGESWKTKIHLKNIVLPIPFRWDLEHCQTIIWVKFGTTGRLVPWCGFVFLFQFLFTHWCSIDGRTEKDVWKRWK